MRKKTALQTPEDRKASLNQTKGLVAKGQKPRQSVQETCVLDNHSHRTLQKLLNRPHPPRFQAQLSSIIQFSTPAHVARGRLGWRPPQVAGTSNFFVS